MGLQVGCIKTSGSWKMLSCLGEIKKNVSGVTGKCDQIICVHFVQQQWVAKYKHRRQWWHTDRAPGLLGSTIFNQFQISQ